MLYGLYDVLSTVGVLHPEMTFENPRKQLLDVIVVAAAAAPFRCYGNVLVEPDFAVDQLTEVDVDVVIVCNMYQPIDTPPIGRYGPEIDWLVRMHAKGAIIVSVCTGSLMLAAAAYWTNWKPPGIGSIGKCFAITIQSRRWRKMRSSALPVKRTAS